ncbi:MAG: hypothetical protein ACFE95_15645 [Candidatus Hodarchaeota archaeon]
MASHFIPDLGYTEFVNFKRESDVSSYHAIIDLLKGHNAQNQHYRNFQMNIYTKRDIYDVEGLRHKRKLIELIKNEDTDGLIVFTIPENLSANLSRFGEIFNSARLEWKQYRKDGIVPLINMISDNIINRMAKYQKVMPNRDEVENTLKMFDFKAKTIYQFVEHAFWNYIWEFFQEFGCS